MKSPYLLSLYDVPQSEPFDERGGLIVAFTRRPMRAAGFSIYHAASGYPVHAGHYIDTMIKDARGAARQVRAALLALHIPWNLPEEGILQMGLTPEIREALDLYPREF